MASTIGLSVTLNGDGDLRFDSELGDVVDGDTHTLVTGVIRQNLHTIEGKQEVEQAIKIRLLTKLGEDVLEPTMGLPLRAIMVVNRDDYTASAIKSCIERDPRVKSVNDVVLEREPATRIVHVTAYITLIDATDLTVSEVFQV